MKKDVLVGLLVWTTLFSTGCKHKTSETVTEEKPYCVEVVRERSIYQAQKIQDRLRSMDVDAYIIESTDSVDQGWYSVMSGAFADSSAGAAHAAHLDSTLRLPGLTLVDSRVMADSINVVKNDETGESYQSESRRIDANAPCVPTSVMDVTRLFPENNAFYLQQLSIANFEAEGGQKHAQSLFEDMPRGITAGRVAAVSKCLVEVQYKDNLYDDKVTISIARLADAAVEKCAGVFDKYNVTQPEMYAESYAVALQYSEYILESGNYEGESLAPIIWKAYKPLVGYRVGLTTNNGTRRTYYMLADSDCEYLFMAQSVQKEDAEMQYLLEAVGRGQGLEQYDEFYNAFYLMPDRQIDEDVFLGFSIEKLGKKYASERGYAQWAKGMVGHWVVNGYFWNRKKGLWVAGIFDLLTPTKRAHIYGTLYTQAQSNKNRRTVYGVPGHFVGNWLVGLELNFGYDRYVCAINSENFGEKEFMDRAERLQLKRGGYYDL